MDWLGDVVATWFLVAERAAWGPIGVGLLLYAGGSTVYNLELSATRDLTFPSRADALWLMLVPLTLTGMIGLVRARHVHADASLWLDGMIGGTVVAALAAVFALHPILATSVGENWASAAHLAYPLGDLLLMGFAVVLWGAGGWRIDAWFGLAAAFALIAMSDAIYVAAQLGGGWTPGTSNDLGYAAGSLLIALAAWGSRRTVGEASPTARVALPIVFTVTAFLLVVYEAFTQLDPVAVAMIRLTLLAVVVRLGLTLWWLSRQRADLEALAASDPLTGLGNYRAFQEHLQRAVAAEETVSLIVLDLDHFKMLNDTFGHAEGDRVLQATATTLSRTVGEAGFVARVGGEEFAIALLSPEVKRALPFDLDGIVIELTEHEAFDEDGALELGLAALRERGARIALDDAGAGYAGLQQLVRLRPEIVKVDRSLIAGIHEDASKLALLQALAGFAGTTGAAVCAAGVEELAELRALAGFDVTSAQGCALARPGPAWPAIPVAVGEAAASADDHGMRLAGAADTGAAPSLGDLADVLARAETIRELNLALGGVTLLLGAEEAAISRLDPVAGCLITVSDHEWSHEGERWSLADFPTTAHVVADQVIGQVIAGDPAGDPAELEVLETAGMSAVLLLPLVFEGTTIALLEIYRRA